MVELASGVGWAEPALRLELIGTIRWPRCSGLALHKRHLLGRRSRRRDHGCSDVAGRDVGPAYTLRKASPSSSADTGPTRRLQKISVQRVTTRPAHRHLSEGSPN
jgi:hypothetical protein